MAGKTVSKRRSSAGGSSSKRSKGSSSHGGKRLSTSSNGSSFRATTKCPSFAKTHPKQGLSVPLLEMNVARLPDEEYDSSESDEDSDDSHHSFVQTKKSVRKTSSQRTPEKSDNASDVEDNDEEYDSVPNVRPVLNQFLPAAVGNDNYSGRGRSQQDLPKVYTPQTKQLLDQLQQECLALNNTISVMKRDALQQAELLRLHQEASGRNNERPPETLNEVQQAVVGKYARAKIFKQIKFVNDTTFRAHTGIINKCLDALGIFGDVNRNLFWKAVKSNIMYHLSQLRNFVKGKLLLVFKGKYDFYQLLCFSIQSAHIT
jgi:hypothetical protein